MVLVVAHGLLGEKYKINDFIQPDNPSVVELAQKLRRSSKKDTLLAAVRFVAENFKYPINWRGTVNTERLTKVFKFASDFWLVEKHKDYGWLLPSQVIEAGYGVCIDTSVLLTSLLRKLNFESFCCVGGLYKRSRKRFRFIGFHAWTIVNFEGWKLIETTVHPDPPPLLDMNKAYAGELEEIKLRYDEILRFNERIFLHKPEKLLAYRRILDYELEARRKV